MKRFARFLLGSALIAAPLSACADYGDTYDGLYAGGPAWYDDGCCGLFWYGGQSYVHHDWHWHGDWNHELTFNHGSLAHGAFGGGFAHAGIGGGEFHAAAAGHAGGPRG